MIKKEEIEYIIEDCIRLFAAQCKICKLKPSEFLKALDIVVEKTKKNTMTDEQFEKRKEKENE